jgi:hypothetical protein
LVELKPDGGVSCLFERVVQKKNRPPRNLCFGRLGWKLREIGQNRQKTAIFSPFLAKKRSFPGVIPTGILGFPSFRFLEIWAILGRNRLKFT